METTIFSVNRDEFLGNNSEVIECLEVQGQGKMPEGAMVSNIGRDGLFTAWYAYHTYEEDGTTYIDAPCACHDCLSGGKGIGHFACSKVPEILRIAYEQGKVSTAYVDGEWKWVLIGD